MNTRKKVLRQYAETPLKLSSSVRGKRAPTALQPRSDQRRLFYTAIRFLSSLDFRGEFRLSVNLPSKNTQVRFGNGISCVCACLAECPRAHPEKWYTFRPYGILNRNRSDARVLRTRTYFASCSRSKCPRTAGANTEDRNGRRVGRIEDRRRQVALFLVACRSLRAGNRRRRSCLRSEKNENP